MVNKTINKDSHNDRPVSLCPVKQYLFEYNLIKWWGKMILGVINNEDYLRDFCCCITETSCNTGCIIGNHIRKQMETLEKGQKKIHKK